MKTIKIIKIYSEEFKKDVNALEVDGELFDWGIEIDSLENAKDAMQNYKEVGAAVVLNIATHFCNCFSDFVGEKMTLEEINKSIQQGFIS
jgi:hypothetical protein